MWKDVICKQNLDMMWLISCWLWSGAEVCTQIHACSNLCSSFFLPRLVHYMILKIRPLYKCKPSLNYHFKWSTAIGMDSHPTSPWRLYFIATSAHGHSRHEWVINHLAKSDLCAVRWYMGAYAGTGILISFCFKLRHRQLGVMSYWQIAGIQKGEASWGSWSLTFCLFALSHCLVGHGVRGF